MTATGYVSTTGDSRKVAKAGDVMTGELTLPDSSPDLALNAASKGYVDTQDATKASLNGAAFTGDVTVTGANLTVKRAAADGAYRFRVTGSGLDLEIAGLDVFISKWANADFSGVQSNVMRWEAAGPHLIGRVQFGTGAFDDVHDIDSGTGVAALGAKNGLANVRLCGRKATAGAPTTGTWLTGDLVLDSAGAWHLCTAGGTPGSWT